MIFWCSIFAVLVITAIVMFAICPKCYSDAPMCIGAICAFCALLVAIGTSCSRAEYIEFEKEVEIMRETVEFIDQVQSPDKMFYVADIATLNKDIAKWQACYETYGAFCIVPPRVLDIAPIGVVY